MDHPRRAFDIRHEDSSGGTALVHGSSVVADASLLGQCIPNSNETVPEPTPATSSTAEESYEEPVLHSGSPGPSALLRSERATPSPDVSADQEASESPDRKKLKLSSEAAATTAGATAHQTAQQHDTEQSQDHASELERLVELQQNAASQPGGTHITTTSMASGGPRKAAHDNRQGAGSTPPCPEREMEAVAGPSTAHQTAQHGPQQPQSEISELEQFIELQQNESDDNSGSPPFRSLEVALDPHLYAPSSPHHLTSPTHEITMDLPREVERQIPESVLPYISFELRAHLAANPSLLASIQAHEAHLNDMPPPHVLEDDFEDELELISYPFRAEE